MAQSNYNIKTFANLVNQLINQHKELKKENAELYAMVDKQDKEIEELKSLLKDTQNQYDMLMAAKMMNIADADIEKTKKRISRMLRTVNQCISLLAEQNETV